MNDDQIHIESEIVESIKKGDGSAFKKLFLRYYLPLSLVAADFLGSKELGKEIVQELLLKIWENRQSWQPNGPLKPYLYRAVCNRALNYKKQEKSRREAIARYHIFMENENQGFEDHEEKEALIAALWDTVEKLPKRQYMVILLHKIHGLNYREIAESLDISVNTVEVHMVRAMKFLRKNLLQEKIT